MSIYLQRLVPIQPRTSPLKFDHLVEKFGVKYGIVSFNLVKHRAEYGAGAGSGRKRDDSPKNAGAGMYA